VQTRTKCITLVRALLRHEGIKPERKSSGTFAQRVREIGAPDALVSELAPVLDLIDALNEKIRRADERVSEIARDETRQQLMSVPGVGPVTAVGHFVATLDDPKRFHEPKQVPRVPRTGPAGAQLWREGTARPHYETRQQSNASPCRPGRWTTNVASRRGRYVAIVALARRIDEARKWQAKAIEFAEKGEEGAVAAMTCLLMGMRCSEVVSRIVRDLDDEGRLLWIPDSKTIAGRRKLQVPDLLQPYLRRMADGRESTAALFGEHWRDWPRKWVQRICKAAGVPKVTAHAMRGLHSTLAVDSGITSHAVAAALGHESFRTTAESYAQRDAVAGAQQKRVLGVLAGGKLAS
jgi:integrase